MWRSENVTRSTPPASKWKQTDLKLAPRCFPLLLLPQLSNTRRRRLLNVALLQQGCQSKLKHINLSGESYALQTMKGTVKWGNTDLNNLISPTCLCVLYNHWQHTTTRERQATALFSHLRDAISPPDCPNCCWRCWNQTEIRVVHQNSCHCRSDA